jgi:hypothetical protein
MKNSSGTIGNRNRELPAAKRSTLKELLFTYFCMNESTGTLNYTDSISEYTDKNTLQMTYKTRLQPNLSTYYTCLEAQIKTRKTLSGNSRCPGRDSNQSQKRRPFIQPARFIELKVL